MAPLSGPASSSGSSRWQLSSIRVRGFKSFGPSWVTVPLPNTNLVGILGPNGSGKSNLLEAVLFAVGCPATSLRVRTLRELASSDAAHAPCEVELTIQRQAAATVASSAGGGGGRRSAVNKGASASASTAAATPPLELHTLRTSLAPDGASRLYQLDGRNRTAQQVKDFLAPRGMALDSGPGTDTSPRVIRQAQVTALADSNDSTALAALIGSASGLVRWRDETRRGSQELEVTRGSLREIRTHLETLQTAVRDDEERLAAASRLASLETEIAAVGGELGAALERWVRQIEDELAACERRESDGQDEIRRLEEAAAAAEVQHQHLVSELEKLLADDAAAAAAVAVAAAAAQYHEHLRAAAVESTAEAAAARERLAAATADVRHLEVLLAEARSETSRLAGAMMASQQYGRDSGAAAASMCGAADAAAAAAASEAASAAAAAADAATATADTAASAVRSTQRQLSEVRARADALRRALQLPPRPPSPLQHQHQPPPPPQAWLPLDLLRFSDPRVAPALLRAFGRQMVAADDAAAAALATRFGLSSVTLAGSVSHRGMLTGGWDGGGGGGGAAARGRQLWERLWELSELIRLEGRLAVLLSQQQGALAAAERRRGEAEAAALEAVAAEEQARVGGDPQFGVAARCGGGEGGGPGGEQRDEMECGQAVQHRIQNLDEQLSAAQQAQHTAAAAATAAELEEAQHREALMHHCGSGTAAASGGGVVQSGVRDGLVAEVTALRARVEELEAARSAALLSVEAAEAEEEAAEARAAGVLAEEVAEARLRERRRLVQDLERSLQEAKEAVAAAALRRQELEASAAIAAVRTADLQAQLRGRRGALRAERESLAAGRAALKRVGQERDAIRREYGSMYAGGDDGGSGGERAAGGAAVAAASEVATKRQVDPGQRKQQDKDDDPERAKDGKAKGEEEKKAEKGAEEDCEKAAAVLRNQLRTLRLERGRLGGSHVSPAQLLQFQERVAAVAVLRERANSLATAADMLQVLAANTAVFNAVRRRFVSLCGRLLPSLDLDLTAPYGCASRGVVVRFRRHNRPDRDPDGGDADGTEADGGSRGGWTEELGQLSGGQRTLVSVALLLGLALALSGGGGGGNSDGGGGLFLLDEVDAALDEHNQAAVAALLRYLSHRGGGCQVLAVTHNAAFQTACNGFVRLTRGPAGTQLEMPGAAGAIAAPHLAAAGPGNGAAAGWGIGGSRGGGSGGGDCGTGGAGGVAGVPAAKKLRTARPRRV
ncbi:hypothetical protein VOLCADRAFT_105201 [Volvox carteri f. nagariensis]|uniref:RecF/RecN/SMC N-terminal domain-containing protein n=1 Tax=Volvox carteri f. nagariensis TaxID=3068 RepID=D8TZ83_VOLCA|nr:uncharacterized protein VOLCADRAFT_105201 [Volvox carteri f. nagariensis]EFJ47136.1 hypothetical protein VOLCADRAFT_105201 [Volvox carteri f. nagariensis]|eukprot:XP_002951685.1 hypothetical protein VOLCADRAFT_105201 [Volvox carteri f. nagariensis]